MIETKSRGEKTFDIINIIGFAILTFVMLYPFWYCFILSINDGQDTLKGGIYFLPRMFTLDNYKQAFADSQIVSAFIVTVGRTVIGTAIAILACAIASYSLSYQDLPFKRPIMFYIFFSSIFGGGLIPTYILYRELGLIDNFWVFVFPSIYSFYNILVVKSYFQSSIPPSLRESALIDGATEFEIFYRIYLPLAKPILATIGLFVAVAHWNDWFAGMYYVKDPNLVPLSSLLQKYVMEMNYTSLKGDNMSNEQLELMAKAVTPESFKMAVLMITTLPIVAVYPFIQKYFVKGVMIGSIKE